jgi:AraC-like DNA-binding protein
MQRWSTRHLPPAQRFGYWREVLCEAFTALDSATTEASRFDSDVSMLPLSDIRVSAVRSSSYTIRRGAREIRKDPAEHYFCDLQISGTSIVAQNGRRAVVRPGEFFIVDTRHAYEADFLGGPGEEWKIVCLQIPRERLDAHLSMPDTLTARRFDTWAGTAALAGNFIRGLTSVNEALDEREQQTLATTLVDLLALAMTPATTRNARCNPHERDRSRVLLHIDSHLADENLGAASVAAAFGISVRYLHRLFEGADSSFARFVSEKRLQRCAADLTASGSRVSDVAYRWGFRDLTHFGRMFRRHYGMSAREWQRDHAGSTP